MKNMVIIKHNLVKFLLGLTAVLTIATLLAQLLTFGLFGQMIGLFALCTESLLGFPQVYSNWSKKSVEGLSVSMVGMWFLGDFSKTCYFIIEKQPFQFILCGAIQLTVDIILIIQIIYYGKGIQYD